MQIRYDLFPAHFTAAPPNTYADFHEMTSQPPSRGATYVATTRVIVTEEVVVVAVDSPEGAQIIFRERYTIFERSKDPNLDSYIVTQSGKTLAFRKDANCGCGSRLRAWNAYKTLNSMKDPTE
jgi:hypothetical protein